MRSYHDFVQELLRVQEQAATLPLATFPHPAHPSPAESAPRVLIFSPHPDDEVIIGGLALRFLRQEGMRVVNVAVTQGSNKARQAARLAELTECCKHIGFELLTLGDHGLESISPKGREQHPGNWNHAVLQIRDVLLQQQPRVILVPHELDRNTTHIGTHFLVMEALSQCGPRFKTHVVETEFWGAMPTPNLMVETSPNDLADLITALSFHVGEVNRNPYHLRLPAWMMDNVRRGGEIVGSQGGAVPDFKFATLYRLRQWTDNTLRDIQAGGRFLPASSQPSSLLIQPETLQRL